MSRNCLHIRSALTCLLTVWMTVAGCGIWVTHAHAAGSGMHVHGWGWHPAGCPICRTTRSDSPSTCHRHLLVLGVECPNDESAAGATPPDAHAGVAVIDQCEAPSPVELPPALPEPGLVVDGFELAPVQQPVTVDHDRNPPSLLPPFALRRVSGVLRP